MTFLSICLHSPVTLALSCPRTLLSTLFPNVPDLQVLSLKSEISVDTCSIPSSVQQYYSRNMSDVHFRCSFINAESSLVLDLLINFLLAPTHVRDDGRPESVSSDFLKFFYQFENSHRHHTFIVVPKRYITTFHKYQQLEMWKGSED